MVPFNTNYEEAEDKELITKSLGGSSEAITLLVNRHQRFIYNLALKLVRDPDDAADMTQEVLIKLVTKLHQFQGKSSFRTWLYRMVVNHFLNSNRKKAETMVFSFDGYGKFLDEVHNDQDMSPDERETYKAEIEKVRNKCMASTLLCLNREQRIVFILGSIFNLKSNVAAEILEISPENFRQQLSRAKADLFNFMNNKCGLINPANPCRCHKKTKGFIKDGLVSPETGKFYAAVTQSIGNVVDQKNKDLDYLMEERYLQLFTGQPYENPQDAASVIQNILTDPLVKQLFHLI